MKVFIFIKWELKKDSRLRRELSRTTSQNDIKKSKRIFHAKI
jgi:hypothetical protein